MDGQEGREAVEVAKLERPETVHSRAGLTQEEFEAVTGVDAWMALKPFSTEKPEGWDFDSPTKFMSEEEKAEMQTRKECGRVFHSPYILKCYNTWEDEASGATIYITDISRAGSGTKTFTCLNLGNVDQSTLRSSIARTDLSAEAKEALTKRFSAINTRPLDT